MKSILFLICITFPALASAQLKPEQAIMKVINDQQTAWNQGDIQAFMKGYWKSDSLMFIGGNGIVYGYNNTWERYKKNYNSREKMGSLQFTILHILPLSPEVYMVVAKWELTRTIGNIGGHFSLIFKRIGNEWLIISDHTSEAKP